MSFLLNTILDTDSISYGVYGFWGCLGRRVLYLLPVHFRQWWTNHVRTIYAPQHSELRAAIPKTWCDLDGCIESFLYTCVISFVEREDGLYGPEDYPRLSEQAKANNTMIKEIYDWAKTGRAAAQQAIQTAYPPALKIDWSKRPLTFEGIMGPESAERRAAYERVDQFEKAMEEKDAKYLSWLVINRGALWT